MWTLIGAGLVGLAVGLVVSGIAFTYAFVVITDWAREHMLK